MTQYIRTKPEALYCVGVPLILFLILSALLPAFMTPAWQAYLAAVLLACFPTAAIVLGRWQWGRVNQPVLNVVSTLSIVIAAALLGPVVLIANLIALCQDKYPLDPMSKLRIRPLIYGVGIALLLSGVLDTLLVL